MVSHPKDVLRSDVGLPRIPTGMSVLGIVKRALNSESIWFGPTFDGSDPQADGYATEQESSARLVDLYQPVRSSPTRPSTLLCASELSSDGG